MHQVTISHAVQGLYDDGFHCRSRLSWVDSSEALDDFLLKVGAGKFGKLFQELKWTDGHFFWIFNTQVSCTLCFTPRGNPMHRVHHFGRPWPRWIQSIGWFARSTNAQSSMVWVGWLPIMGSKWSIMTNSLPSIVWRINGTLSIYMIY